MKAEIIWISTRSAVLEITGKGKFKTENAYKIYINGTLYKVSTYAVETLKGLKPSADYVVTLVGLEPVEVSLSFQTKQEYVTLDVKKFGAIGDGESDDTLSIQTAILCCPKNGRVYIPRGVYRVSSIFLKDDVHIEIGKDAVLSAFTEKEKFSILPGMIECYDETEDYNLGSWEGNPLPTYASIFTGIHVSNVIISGEGTLEGNGSFDNWWSYKREKGMPFRPKMIFLNHCKNVVIHGITIQNSPSWTIHPYFTDDLKLMEIKICNPANSPNTDGLDPESCKNVDIIGVHFDVGDDCIAVKSGKIYMGAKWKTPCENMTIRNCYMEHGHGAVTIGSEMAGGVKNLTVKDCVFFDTDRGLRIKTRRGRGKDAIIENVCFEDIEMDQVKTPFVVNNFYFCDPDGHTEYVRTKKALPVDERTPKIRSMSFRNIKATNCHHAGFFFYGLPEQKIEKIQLEEIEVSFAKDATAGYPAMMEELDPVSKLGFYGNNIEELQVRHVTIKGHEGEPFQLENIGQFTKE